jgi:hypothetical protein
MSRCQGRGIRMSLKCPRVEAKVFECLSNAPGSVGGHSNIIRMSQRLGGGTRVSLECPRVAWGAFECHSNIIQISFKYHSNIIQISSKYHSNIIQISFEYPSVWGGALECHSNAPGSGGGHSSVTRISLSQEVKCHSSAPGSGRGVRMPEGRGEWVSFECPRVGTRPRLAQIRPGPRQDQPSLSQSALSQSALGCPARPSLTQPDSGPHQGRAQFQLAWPLPGSAQLGSAQLNYHAKQTS